MVIFSEEGLGSSFLFLPYTSNERVLPGLRCVNLPTSTTVAVQTVVYLSEEENNKVE